MNSVTHTRFTPEGLARIADAQRKKWDRFRLGAGPDLLKICGDNSRKHGHTGGGKRSPEYKCWSAMIQRCEAPYAINFTEYGGSGIAVCPEWHDFARFLEDMGPRPSLDHSIGRKNNDLGYNKSNCEWQTRSQQQRNKTAKRVVTALGQTRHVSEWAEINGLTAGAIWNRVTRGWHPDRAVSEPKTRRG